MRWVVSITAPLAAAFVALILWILVLSIYYRGKSDGWVEGFDARNRISNMTITMENVWHDVPPTDAKP